jgi:hypothetical protein
MPEKLSNLAISCDFKKLICSSEFNSIKKNQNDLEASGEGSQLSASSAGEGE